MIKNTIYNQLDTAVLIADRKEAWGLETVGQYWVAEQVTSEA